MTGEEGSAFLFPSLSDERKTVWMDDALAFRVCGSSRSGGESDGRKAGSRLR